jgi:hypothetical protein
VLGLVNKVRHRIRYLKHCSSFDTAVARSRLEVSSATAMDVNLLDRGNQLPYWFRVDVLEERTAALT